MNTRILRVAALHAIAMSVAFAAHTRLAIGLVDSTGIPDQVRSRALKLAQRAFAEAGIRVEWSTSNKSSPAEGRHVSIHLIPTATAARPAGPLPEGDLAGYAFTGYGRGYIFYDAIQAFAGKSHRPPSLILACVLIHEIAHALGLTHRVTGVMRPGLRPRDMLDAVRGLAFTPTEARQLRTAAAGLNASN